MRTVYFSLLLLTILYVIEVIGQTNIFIGAILSDSVLYHGVFNQTLADANQIFSESLSISGEYRICSTEYCAAKAFIELSRKGAIGIIGRSTNQAMTVTPLANQALIPYISYTATNPDLSNSRYTYFSRTVGSDETQGGAILDVMEYLGWDELALLSGPSAFAVAAIQSLRKQAEDKGYTVTTTQYLSGDSTTADVSTQITAIEATGTRIIVACSGYAWAEPVYREFLSQQLNASTHVLFGCFDFIDQDHTIDSDVLAQMSGMIGMKIDNPDTLWRTAFETEFESNYPTLSSSLGNYALSMYDAIMAVATAAYAVVNDGISIGGSANLTGVGPSDVAIQRNGALLRAELLSTSYVSGVSGPVSFDDNRERSTDYALVNLVDGAFVEVGTWDAETTTSPFTLSNAITWVDGTVYPSVPRDSTSSLRNVLLISQSNGAIEPFWEWDSNGDLDDCFMKTMIEYILDELGLAWDDITWTVSSLSYQQTLEMMATSETYDAAFADFSITTSRSQLVTFATPFYHSSLTPVVKYDSDDTHMWSFLDPFDWQVWLCFACSTLIVGLGVWLFEREAYDPNDIFRAPHDRIGSEISPGKKGVFAGVWYSAMSVFYSPDIVLKTLLGRMMQFVWYFCVLVLTATYTANMAAFLTVSETVTPITDLTDINPNEAIAVFDGATAHLDMIERGHENFITVSSYEEALEYLSNGDASAYVAQTQHAEYIEQIECEYITIGPDYQPDNLGFALSPNMEQDLIDDINSAIVQAWDENYFEDLELLYFTSDSCGGTTADTETTSLTLSHLGGLFVMMSATVIVVLVIHACRKYAPSKGFCLWMAYDDPDKKFLQKIIKRAKKQALKKKRSGKDVEEISDVELQRIISQASPRSKRTSTNNDEQVNTSEIFLSALDKNPKTQNRDAPKTLKIPHFKRSRAGKKR